MINNIDRRGLHRTGRRNGGVSGMSGRLRRSALRTVRRRILRRPGRTTGRPSSVPAVRLQQQRGPQRGGQLQPDDGPVPQVRVQHGRKALRQLPARILRRCSGSGQRRLSAVSVLSTRYVLTSSSAQPHHFPSYYLANISFTCTTKFVKFGFSS